MKQTSKTGNEKDAEVVEEKQNKPLDNGWEPGDKSVAEIQTSSQVT
jgi:hypothetical protein